MYVFIILLLFVFVNSIMNDQLHVWHVWLVKGDRYLLFKKKGNTLVRHLKNMKWILTEVFEISPGWLIKNLKI